MVGLVVVGFATTALIIRFTTIAVVVIVRIANLCSENSGFFGCIGCNRLRFLCENMHVVVGTCIHKDYLGVTFHAMLC